MSKKLIWPLVWGVVGLLFGTAAGFLSVIYAAVQAPYEPTNYNGVWVSALAYGFAFALLSAIIGYIGRRGARIAKDRQPRN